MSSNTGRLFHDRVAAINVRELFVEELTALVYLVPRLILPDVSIIHRLHVQRIEEPATPLESRAVSAENLFYVMLPEIVVEVVISDGSVFENFGMDDMEMLPIAHGHRDYPRQFLHDIEDRTLSENRFVISSVLQMFSPTTTMIQENVVAADIREVLDNHFFVVASNLVVPGLVQQIETFEIIWATVRKVTTTKQTILRRIKPNVGHKLIEQLAAAVDVPDHKVSTSSVYVYVFVHE